MTKLFAQILNIAFTLTALSACAFADFPAPITKCILHDEKCLIEQAQKFTHEHPHGIPALGIENMEPMYLGDISIKGDSKSSVNIALELKDAELYNYTQSKFTKFTGFVNDTSKPMKIIIWTECPQMTLKAKYKMNGQILVLPIRGAGDLEWRMTGLKTKSKVIVTPVKRGDLFFMNFTSYQLLVNMDHVHMNMTNLFNGEKELSDNILHVMNENWRLLAGEFKSYISEAIGNWHLRNLQSFLGNIPSDDFFLPAPA